MKTRIIFLTMISVFFVIASCNFPKGCSKNKAAEITGESIDPNQSLVDEGSDSMSLSARQELLLKCRAVEEYRREGGTCEKFHTADTEEENAERDESCRALRLLNVEEVENYPHEKIDEYMEHCKTLDIVK